MGSCSIRLVVFFLLCGVVEPARPDDKKTHLHCTATASVTEKMQQFSGIHSGELGNLASNVDFDLKVWGLEGDAPIAPQQVRECPEGAADFEQPAVYAHELSGLWKRSLAGCKLSPSSEECRPLGNGALLIEDDVLAAIKTGEVEVKAADDAIKSVGIIGGGPSGLLSAKFLRDIGIEAVVFEAAERVGGKADTWIDPETGKAHDMATKWIPTVSAMFDSVDGKGHFIIGPPPIQRKTIDEVKEAGLEEQLSGGFSYFDTGAKLQIQLPPILQKYSKLKMAGDFVQGLNAFFAIAACPGAHGVVDCGVALPGESTEEWGRRLGIEAFTDMLCEYVDGLGDGQAKQEFVGYPLKSRSYFLLVTIVQKLASTGVFDDSMKGKALRATLPPMGRWAESLINGSVLQDIMDQPATVMFKQGYSGFWDLFVKRYSLNVTLKSRVTAIRSVSDRKTEITTSSGRKHTFDHIFIAVPPAAASTLLPNHYRGYFENVSTVPIETVAWRAAQRVQFPTSEPNVLFYPESCESNLGGSNGVIRTGKAYALADEYQDGVYVTIGYPGEHGQEWRTSQHEQLTKLGLVNATVVHETYRDWPSVVLAPSYATLRDWTQENQGRNGWTLVGEEFSGNNIPALMEDIASLFVTGRWKASKSVQGPGQVRVGVIHAEDLENDHWLNPSDPYVKLNVCGQRAQTPVVDDRRNPVWNWERTFNVTRDCTRLALELWDKDEWILGDDDKYHQEELAFRTDPGETKTLTFQLWPTGKLVVSITWIPGDA